MSVMRSRAPRTGGDEVTLGEHQLDYAPITVTPCHMQSGPGMLTRWTFTADQRKRIADGEDVYVLQEGVVLHPMAVFCGPEGFRIPEDVVAWHSHDEEDSQDIVKEDRELGFEGEEGG